MRLILLAFFAILSSHYGIRGQQLSYSVDHFSVEHGLVDRRVRSILEHSNGFVYVGTANGLSRFDGYSFIDIDLSDHFAEFDGLLVGSLTELSDGDILLIANPIQAFKVISDVTLIIELDALTLSSEIRDQFNGTNADIPKPYIIDADTLYHEIFGTQRFGAPRNLDKYGNTFVIDAAEFMNSSYALLILSTGDTLDLTDPILTTGSYFQVFSEDYSKTIYVATNNSGLLRISIEEFNFDQILSSNAQAWQYDNICRGALEVDDKLLIATQEGLYAWDPISKTGEKIPLTLDDPNLARDIRSIHRIHADSILIAGRFGVGIVSIETWEGGTYGRLKEIYYADHAIDLKDGSVLVSGNVAGVGRVIGFAGSGSPKPRLVYLREIGFEEGFLESVLFEDSNRNIWLGTTRGLLKISYDDREIQSLHVARDEEYSSDHFQVLDDLSSSHIISIGEYDHTIWVGYYDQGIDVIDTNGIVVRRLSEENGLTNNSVCILMPDNTGMWIGTFNGLGHYDPGTSVFSSFSLRNGLSHSEFNRWSGHVLEDGTYVFGTMNGLTAFNPQVVLAQEDRAKVLISEVGLYARDGVTPIVLRNIQDEVPSYRLPSANRSFYVNVALSDMRNSDKNFYQYRLITDGVSGHWQNNGNDRQIRFEHLPAGRHHLEINGVSASGVSSPFPKIIELDVREFFYKEPWFLLLCVAIVSLVMWMFYRMRLAQVIRVERLRTRLSSDLHDDVGGLLSGVAFQMDLLDRTVDEKHKALVRRVAESSRKAMVRMRDVIWAIDARNSTYGDLVLRMQEYANEQLAPLGIDFQLTSKGIQSEDELPAEVRHGLILIFKEFVTNSIKHANASRIDMTMSRSRARFVCVMQDNGVGADLSQVTSGQGLDNMRMRTQKMNGEIAFDAQNGFRLEIVLPGI